MKRSFREASLYSSSATGPERILEHSNNDAQNQIEIQNSLFEYSIVQGDFLNTRTFEQRCSKSDRNSKFVIRVFDCSNQIEIQNSLFEYSIVQKNFLLRHYLFPFSRINGKIKIHHQKLDCMENGKRNDLEDRLVAFAVMISALTEALPSTSSGKYITG
jgi:hypothetical protein